MLMHDNVDKLLCKEDEELRVDTEKKRHSLAVNSCTFCRIFLLCCAVSRLLQLKYS